MRALSNAKCLELWDYASAMHPLDRALAALHLVRAGEPNDVLADWPLGRRNRALAELRCASFGPLVEGWVSCPECSEKLQFDIDARALAEPHSPERSVTVDGQSFRVPTSRDLGLVANETNPERAARQLLAACRVERNDPPDWTESEIDTIGEHLALADPLAETRLSLVCADCGNQWDETFDIASFLWTEISVRARRLLQEVHALASAYGWSERDILAMSDRRRAMYLEMA